MSAQTTNGPAHRGAAADQSRDDLRDERGGATDPVSTPRPQPDGEVPRTRTPHADSDPRRPAPDAVDPQPEGLRRERTDPLSPDRGRSTDGPPSRISTVDGDQAEPKHGGGDRRGTKPPMVT